MCVPALSILWASVLLVNAICPDNLLSVCASVSVCLTSLSLSLPPSPPLPLLQERVQYFSVTRVCQTAQVPWNESCPGTQVCSTAPLNTVHYYCWLLNPHSATTVPPFLVSTAHCTSSVVLGRKAFCCLPQWQAVFQWTKPP